MSDEIEGTNHDAGHDIPPIEWDDDVTETKPEPKKRGNGSAGKPRLAAVDGNTALAPEPDDAPLPVEFSDDALADQWVDKHAEDWRYVARWATWFEWQSNSWKRCETAKYFDLARIVTREAVIRPEAAALNASGKRKVNSASTAAALLHFVKANPRIAATIEQWDADAYALATPEGVIDLKIGKLLEASREQYCTRLTSVAPKRGPMPLWEACLSRWFGGDAGLIHYAQLFCGYCLTGDTCEKKFLFVHGPADGGKSKFVEAIQSIMGTYAQAASMDTFTETKHERHSTELAELAGARFVAAPETEEGARWNQSRINALTGKDRIRARFMRQDNFEFVPQFKLLVYGNHAPHLNNVDSAIRRRLHILPFPHSIPREEQDPHLAEKLVSEYPAILDWMIQGCIQWQEHGLPMPEIITQATEDYLRDEDNFGNWIEDRTRRDPHAFTTSADLYADYKAYTVAEGDATLGSKRFWQRLQQRGFTRGKSADKSKRGFNGLRLWTAP